MEFDSILEDVVSWLRSSGLKLVVIVVGALVSMWISRFLINRLFAGFAAHRGDGEMKKRADTLSALIRWVINTTIMAVAVFMILGMFGIEIGPVLAAAGIVGVAVGFGSQQLVQDVISGFFILMEDQIRVGDVVQVAGKSGLVERVTLRMTILRDLTGNVHFVRNGHIDVVTNMTKEYSYYLFDVGVAYRESVDDVVAVLKEIDEGLRSDADWKDDILAPLEILGLDRFEDSAVVVRARLKTKPIRQWAVGREFNRRMKQVFDERDIEIPFPHVTLYMGQPKEGSAAPLNIISTGDGSALASQPGTSANEQG